MHTFAIWTPLANRMSINVNGVTQAMQGPDSHRWWNLPVQDANEGADYGFLIDDDPTIYPDPRSAWQPDGVHELSRIYDHDSFEWTDTKFQPLPLASSIIYELHIGTFTPEGTFDSAIDRLDYLVQLGITHVELMPVASFE